MGFYCRDCGKDVDEKQSDQTMSDDTILTQEANRIGQDIYRRTLRVSSHSLMRSLFRLLRKL
jgi:hypothetical protein